MKQPDQSGRKGLGFFFGKTKELNKALGGKFGKNTIV